MIQYFGALETSQYQVYDNNISVWLTLFKLLVMYVIFGYLSSVSKDNTITFLNLVTHALHVPNLNSEETQLIKHKQTLCYWVLERAH